jgi:C_GCAxxG_C_C family probable redox protein
MSTIQEKALALHASGSNCAQSVLCAFSGDVGFDFAQAHRFTTCMGAGLGRRQLLCGAVSGGALAIGAALGNDSGADLATKERCYGIVNDYVAKLESEFGSSDCRTLLGVDISTEAGRAEVKARGLGDAICNKIIARAAELAEKAIAAAKG